LDLAGKYLSIAEDDLKAAHLLRNASSALTVYHLQQAVEKATKAFCLVAEIATPEELKESSHRTPQPLLSLVGKFPRMMELVKMTSGKDYRRMLKDVNLMANNEPEKLKRLQKGAIEIVLKIFDAVSQSRQLLDNKEDEVKRALASCLPAEYAEVKDLFMASTWTRYGVASAQCYLLGALTFAHEGSTRYPGGLLEPQDYNPNLGIVQAILEITERTSQMLTSVREIVSFAQKRQVAEQ